MSYLSVLRRLGVLKEVPDAKGAEDALRENQEAFEQMSRSHSEFPEANAILKKSIEKSSSPFADLESMMKTGRTSTR